MKLSYNLQYFKFYKLFLFWVFSDIIINFFVFLFSSCPYPQHPSNWHLFSTNSHPQSHLDRSYSAQNLSKVRNLNNRRPHPNEKAFLRVGELSVRHLVHHSGNLPCHQRKIRHWSKSVYCAIKALCLRKLKSQVVLNQKQETVFLLINHCLSKIQSRKIIPRKSNI